MAGEKTTLQWKLMIAIMSTSIAVLALTCAVFITYEYVTFRKTIVQRLTLRAEIIAANASAALAFQNEADATEILSILAKDPHMMVACLFEKEGRVFAKYPAAAPTDLCPTAPEKQGYRFGKAEVVVFNPVVRDNRRLGTLYLKSDLTAMSERFRLYAMLVGAVVTGSILVAFGLSTRLLKRITGPILNLAATAKIVSEQGDYSIRASKFENDEVGQLTEGFNQMLGEIQAQHADLKQKQEQLTEAVQVSRTAETALRESQERVSLALEAAEIGHWELDLVSGTARRSPLHDRIFGYAELAPKWNYDIFLKHVHPEDRARVDESFQAGVAAGDWNFESRIIRADQAARWIWARGHVFKDSAGQQVRMLGLVADITERKRAEEAMRRFRIAMETSLDGIFLMDFETFHYLDVNETGCKMLGYSRDELLIMRTMDSNPGITEAEQRRRFDAAKALGSDRVMTEPEGRFMRRRDGSTFPIEVGRRYMRIGEQEIIVGIARDITERKQAEQKIRTQLEHLSLLDQITRTTGERLDLRSIFQIVLVRLEDNLSIDFGCVCLFDPAATTLRVTCVGAKSGTLAGDLMMDEQALIDIDENGLSRCIQGQLVYEPDIGQVRFPFPERLARAGLGSLVLAPLRSESRVFGMLVVARCQAHAFSSGECEFLRQLSEHVALAAHQAQLYTSLQQAYDDLRQSQQAMVQEERLRALGQMASGIAHDVNNALSPVSLYVESLLETERNLSDRARGYLEIIQRAVEDVAQTIARLREFYRQREGQLALAPVQMNSMVQQVLELTRARWRDMPQSRGAVVRALAELAPDLPQIMGVEGEIREALTNLVFNAVDAMPEGGTLTLRTRLVYADPHRPAVVVEVTDTGAGMDEDTRRRCLEPFFTTKGERGTGLGLAMVFGMVQRHSAELAIDSTPGAGTTMRLVFAVPTAVQAASGQPAAALEAPSRLRLLLIDDDPMLLKSLRDALETDHHSIVTANGGEAGIAAFRAALDRGQYFAAVITDLGMPYVDGRRVAAAVKAAMPATPVIMLTGWGQRLAAEGDIPPHVDRVLAKPPKLGELREALALLCQSAATRLTA